jgi:peptide/nickel transport system ATP-binding protein
MRQRIVIALALAGEPELIIADEPTTALDVSIQAQILALLKRLAKTRDTAIMLVTHDMGVIAEVADRVAVMYAGRLVEIGAVNEIVRRANHPYTAGLMASIPSLNRQPDRLAQIDGSMPRLGNWPKGCAFHLRCTHAGPRCGMSVPPLTSAGGTLAACFLHQGGTGT